VKREPSDILRDCLAGKCDREISLIAHRAGLQADRLLRFIDEPTVELTAEEKRMLGAVTLVGKYFEKTDA
jgi:hypothetical protein